MAPEANKAGGEQRAARILLVDDHPIVRQGLAKLIEQEPGLEVCGEAADAPAAWELIGLSDPQLVIVDLSLKAGDGIDLIKRIRAAYADLPILVVSMYEQSHYIERAMRAGAWGYVTKHEASEKVLVAIRKLLAGEIYLGEHVSPRLLQRLMSGCPAEDECDVARLSDREFQVFQMIGSGYGVQEIAARLNLSVKTIETYQAHIREKLDLPDGRKLLQYAVRWMLSQEKK
jgi:DNA-binding NarL/FixJ family response regulator